jgi:flavin reductase (DIM6/NTAB) family NADH-FMN oxidoreductase RutF
VNIEAYFKITYGIYVVSSLDEKKINGYISNTVFQVTADPAQIAVVCSKNNYTAAMIQGSKAFTISALKNDTRADIISTFGYKSGREIDKFNSFAYKKGSIGAPILLDDTLAWFECEVVQQLDVGSHLLFVGKVIDCNLLDAQGEPLTYAYYRENRKGKAPKNAPTYIDPQKLNLQAKMTKADSYYCPSCGYIYNPEKGDPDSGIAAGTRFEDIPDTWVCPVCGTKKEDFEKVE